MNKVSRSPFSILEYLLLSFSHCCIAVIVQAKVAGKIEKYLYLKMLPKIALIFIWEENCICAITLSITEPPRSHSCEHEHQEIILLDALASFDFNLSLSE